MTSEADHSGGMNNGKTSPTVETPRIHSLEGIDGYEYKFKDGQYILPVDGEESKRLDLQNHICHLSLNGKLYLAPLDPKHLQNVLDVGTGTGTWAIEFAKYHPQAKIIGSDISSIERPKSFVRDDLPNLTFEIGNAEEEWTFNDTKFDFVHGRMLMLCFKNVKGVFARAFEALKPGGWLEMQDTELPLRSDDGSLDGTALAAGFSKWIKIGEMRGVPFGTEPPNYKRYMEEVGFVDVQVEKRIWPTGPWMEDRKMKEIGMWSRANQINGLQALHRATSGSTPKEAVEAEVAAITKDLMNPDIHAYMPLYVVWGRKPEY